VKSCRKGHTSSGKRFVVLHAGTKNGFVENASLLFSTKSKSADYHDSMDQHSFKKWVLEKLILNLAEPSLVVMDNASYHSFLVEPIPQASWNKTKLKEWLASKNVPFPEAALKVELVDLCNQHKEKRPRYAIDELLQENGHEVLRLPPYHCQYNPIEMVWGICKQYYDRHIGEVGYGEQQIHDMWQKALEQITPEIWANCVKHTEAIIEKDWQREVHFDVEPLIINVNESSEDEDDELWNQDDAI
jgi:transposase